VIERIAVAALALLCAGWLAVSFTAARAEDELRAATFATPDVARATKLADTASRFTPGVRRILYLGEIELRAGDARKAIALGRQAVGQEPENAEAWLLLTNAAAKADPALAARAAARLRELVPPVPAP